jgi:hypothetical protein
MLPLAQPWNGDVSADALSGCTLEELQELQARNRQWSKELRRRKKSLVSSRLADEITQEDYLVFRGLTHEDLLECQRRASWLQEQIVRVCSGMKSRGAAVSAP